MEVNFEDLSDDLDYDIMKEPDEEFDYDIEIDDSHFNTKNYDKIIMDTHKKLLDYKNKFERSNLFGLMDLNVEYRNYYNSLKAITVEDNACILDVPIIKMDVEQIDDVITKKQAERIRKEEPKKNGFTSQFKWKFNF